MILTCPDCSTRYSVDDKAVGPNGRTVRCSNCSATWFVSHEADTLALKDNLTDGITAVEAATEPPATQETAPPPKEQPENHSAQPVMGAHVQVRDRADQVRRNRRLVGVSMIWIVTLGILGAAGTLGYLLRQDIVNYNPALSSFYQALNIPVKVAGLDFEDPSTRNIIIDGRPVLVVNGVIINRSDQEQALPLVELSLMSNTDDPITSWLVPLDQPTLGARQRLAYMSQYPNPPVDAVRLQYKFVDEAETLTETPIEN